MTQKYALVIGNSVFLDENLMRLKAPDVDVNVLVEILMDPEIGGFDDVRPQVNVGSSIVRKAIADLYYRKKPDDLLVLYFSGHGILDEQGRLYLAVKDTEHNLLSATAIPAKYITEEMDNSRSRRQVLILDCCHSGAFSRGSKGITGASVDTATTFKGTGYGRVILTATDSTQFAWEGDKIIGKAENSLFTHFLVQGLQSGQADANQDGQVTVDELYDYIYAEVVRNTPQQTPGKWSYKEQGDIVLAKSPGHEQHLPHMETTPEPDDQLKEQAEQFYTRGLSAYWLENWDKAIQNLTAYLKVHPHSEDAENKLHEARRQARLRDAYLRAQAAIQREDWQTSIEILEGLINDSPNYKDTAVQLTSARKKKQAGDLYSQAEKLFQAKEWEAVIKVMQEIETLQPGFPDPGGMLDKAKIQVAEKERQKEMALLYRRALGELDSLNLLEARSLIQRLIAMDPNYEEAAPLLVKIEDAIQQEQEQRIKVSRVSRLYEQARKLAVARQWSQVLDTFIQIDGIDPNFHDVDGLKVTAAQALKSEQEEVIRLNELAGLYADAVTSLKNEQYSQALEKWKRVQELDSAYPDPKKVQETARRKLASITISQRLQKFSVSTRRWIILAFALGALMLMFAALPEMKIHFLQSQNKPTAGVPLSNPVERPASTATQVVEPTSEEPIEANADSLTGGAPAVISPTPDPLKTFSFRMIVNTSSDWTTVTIRSPRANYISHKEVYKEGEFTRSSFVIESKESQRLNIQQQIGAASAGNWIAIEEDIIVKYPADTWFSDPIYLDIEIGAIGETTVDVVAFWAPSSANSDQNEAAGIIWHCAKNETDQEDVKTCSLYTNKLSVSPDFSTLNRVLINLGRKNEEVGLSLVSGVADGFTTETSTGSKPAITNLPNELPSRNFYFKVDPSYKWLKTPHPLVVMVEYFDQGDFDMWLEYDSEDSTLPYKGAYKQTAHVKSTNSNVWKTAVFELPGAYLQNRQNNNADFRLSTGQVDLVINRVIVYAP